MLRDMLGRVKKGTKRVIGVGDLAYGKLRTMQEENELKDAATNQLLNKKELDMVREKYKTGPVGAIPKEFQGTNADVSDSALQAYGSREYPKRVAEKRKIRNKRLKRWFN